MKTRLVHAASVEIIQKLGDGIINVAVAVDRKRELLNIWERSRDEGDGIH